MTPIMFCNVWAVKYYSIIMLFICVKTVATINYVIYCFLNKSLIKSYVTLHN